MNSRSDEVVESPERGGWDRAAMFKALGDPLRLRIFEFLCDCCCAVAVEESGDVRPVEGATVGEVCCHITGSPLVTSTVSEQLKELRIAGLIVTERRGRHVICRVNPDALQDLAAFFAAQAGAAIPSSPGRCC